MHNWTTVLAGIITLMVGTHVHADLLSNGGMEAPGVDGSTVITDWDESGDGGSAQASPDQFEGSFFASTAFTSTFAGGQVVTLSQTFTAPADDLYDLSFAYQLSESFCGCDDMLDNARMYVHIDGLDVGLGDLVQHWDDNAFGDIAGTWSSTRWATINHSVNLTAGPHTFAFVFERDSSTYGRNYRFGVDGASLVPEPASAMLIGLAGLATVGHRRRVR